MSIDSGRTAEQAAAETLLAVGRQGGRSASGSPRSDDDEQRPHKRQRSEDREGDVLMRVAPQDPAQLGLPPPQPQHHRQQGGYDLPPLSAAVGSARAPQTPTYAELEQHYKDLHSERRRLDELAERHERMMAGVRRAMEDMRASGSGGGSNEPEATSVRLPSRERPEGGAPVWSWEKKE